MDIKRLLEISFLQAKTTPINETTAGGTHRKRSQTWVESLAANFRTSLAADEHVRVFSKYTQSHRKDFGLNEFLYDVLVCRVAVVPSARHGKPLSYVHDVLWQVESELAEDSRQALLDFNKLVLGRGDNKLFVGPHVRDKQAFLHTLLPAAQRCTNIVYAALIPHPRTWDTTEARVDVWQLNEEQWQEIQ